jgi:hypothetical protein
MSWSGLKLLRWFDSNEEKNLIGGVLFLNKHGIHPFVDQANVVRKCFL